MQTITDSRSLDLQIRKERKTQNLTQVQLAGLAGLAGVGVRFLRELEAGKPSCQIGLVLKVAAAMGIAISVGLRWEHK